MSSAPPGTNAPSSVAPSTAASTGGPSVTTRASEIKLISHSNLFYWWPVWFLAFFMAMWTYFENHRLAIVPPHGTVKKDADGNFELSFQAKKDSPLLTTKSLDDSAKLSEAKKAGEEIEVFRPRISQHSWLGSLFVIILVITIIITNVPLRGLWSFLVIMAIVMLAILITLFKAWDDIFEKVGNLHIHINMAGYLFLGVAVLIVWAVATFVFDRRSYIIFTPGQIRVCEHVGASVVAFSTMGVTLEKQRDDLFRHYILGFGSGDLIIKLATGDRREIRMPNVLGIGWKIKSVEDMLRSVATT